MAIVLSKNKSTLPFGFRTQDLKSESKLTINASTSSKVRSYV